ncbi:hypothetical protein BH24ACT15_BH24ACT15_34850 [soil metagenome]
MIDVRRLLVATLRADPVIAPLLGATASDPRVYWYYQPSAEISSTRQAYITYAQTAFPPTDRSATGDPVFTLAICGLNIQVVETIRDRLVALFDERQLATSAGRIIHGTRLAEHDSFQEHTKFAGRNMQFRFGFSKV